MNYRSLGRTGLRVSGLALGTVELGLDYGLKVPGAYGRPTEAEAIHLVHAALDAGINFIDTARAYGDSEEILGRALASRRTQVVLATKVSTQKQDGTHLSGDALKQHMLTNLDTSLRLLGTDYVDIWQIHNVDEAALSQLDLIGEVFDKVQAAGKVRFVGGSSYGTDIPLRVLATDRFDMLQVTYSVLDQRLADRVFSLATEKNIGIVVRSILLQGVLTERGDYLPDRLAALRQRSYQFRRLIAESPLELSPAQTALAFGLANSQIGAVLVGVRTLAELEENLHATNTVLPDELLTALYRLRLDDPDLLNPGTWNLD